MLQGSGIVPVVGKFIAALGPFRSFEGGSVLLKTTASGQAITALAGTARTVSRNIPSIANGLSG